MVSFVEIFLLSAICIGIYYYLVPKRKYNLPPGSWNPLPKALQSHETYKAWEKNYGQIFRTKFGFWDAIVLSDPTLIREALNSPVISDRQEHTVFDIIGKGHGVVSSNGKTWLELRRFTIRTLRDFGFGKHTMEGFIMEEVKLFLNWMKEQEGTPTDMDQRFVLASVNSLWTLIAGERTQQDDTIIGEIIQSFNPIMMEMLGARSPLMSYPQLIDIVPNRFLKSWRRLQSKVEPFLKIFQDAIEQHIENPADKKQPRDLIDTYLNEIEGTTDQNSVFYGDNGRKGLNSVVADLYVAGEVTTSTTLNWAVLYLITFPEIQAKFQIEMDVVVGQNRHPTLADRPNLPYTIALVNEILRYSSLTPLGLFRKVTQDTTLGGYDIKKGTIVIPNFYSVHYSKEFWEDPENFRPERFLSYGEEKLLKSDNLMAFGVGKRVCLGESLAKDNIFLFLTNIFHKFKIIADPENPIPSLEPKRGFLRQPHKFTVIMIERSN